MSGNKKEEQQAFTEDPSIFSSFKEATPQKTIDADRLLEQISIYNPDLYHRLEDSSQLITLTSLGAGDGEIEFILLQRISAMRGTSENIVIHCIDPSVQMRDAFIQKAEKLGMMDMVGNYFVSNVEDPKCQIPVSDIILASHSMYYVEGWRKEIPEQENTLVKIHRSINKGGVSVYILQSDHGHMGKLRKDFRHAVGFAEEETNAELFVDSMRRTAHIPHNDFVTSTSISYLDVSSIFVHGIFDPSVEGEKLLSFIFRKPWKVLPSRVRQEIQKRIEQYVEEYRSSHGNDLECTRIEIIDTMIFVPSEDMEDKKKFQEIVALQKATEGGI